MSDPIQEPFTIEVTEVADGMFVVALSGEMDIATSPELTSRLATVRGAEPYHVLIDLSELAFVDSTGIKALITAAQDVEEHGGSLIAFAPTANLRRVFDIVHLSAVVPIVDSLQSAIARAHAGDAAGALGE
jgi:anti-sigma B factor antagonist